MDGSVAVPVREVEGALRLLAGRGSRCRARRAGEGAGELERLLASKKRAPIASWVAQLRCSASTASSWRPSTAAEPAEVVLEAADGRHAVEAHLVRERERGGRGGAAAAGSWRRRIAASAKRARQVMYEGSRGRSAKPRSRPLVEQGRGLVSRPPSAKMRQSDATALGGRGDGALDAGAELGHRAPLPVDAHLLGLEVDDGLGLAGAASPSSNAARAERLRGVGVAGEQQAGGLGVQRPATAAPAGPAGRRGRGSRRGAAAPPRPVPPAPG